MGADYSFYVKFIPTFALTFFGYIISVLTSASENTVLKTSNCINPNFQGNGCQALAKMTIMAPKRMEIAHSFVHHCLIFQSISQDIFHL